MARYLLDCECGGSVAVEAGQAGRQVTCTCGRTLDVPPLRMLRHLPTAAPADAEKTPPASAWSARHGIITLCLLVAGVLAVIAAWNRYTEPVVPEFDPELHTTQMGRQIDELTPEQAWQVWVYQYKPMAEQGFSEMANRQEPLVRAEIDRRRFVQTGLLVLAGLLTAIAVAAALWPRGQTRRHGDKETGRGGG